MAAFKNRLAETERSMRFLIPKPKPGVGSFGEVWWFWRMLGRLVVPLVTMTKFVLTTRRTRPSLRDVRFDIDG